MAVKPKLKIRAFRCFLAVGQAGKATEKAVAIGAKATGRDVTKATKSTGRAISGEAKKVNN